MGAISVQRGSGRLSPATGRECRSPSRSTAAITSSSDKRPRYFRHSRSGASIKPLKVSDISPFVLAS